MILLLGDLHGHFAAVNAQAAHAAQWFGEAPAAAVVLGDFGLFRGDLRAYFRRRAFSCPVYFIEGNHEDFSAFDRLCRDYRTRFTHLPRGTVQTVAGCRLLCLGGARFIDPRLTPPGAVVTDADIDRALAHPPGSVDCIISHDSPAGTAVPATNGHSAGLARAGELVGRYRPRLWLFAHHHCWHAEERDGTAYYGLAESWEGYGVLRHGAFTTVRHPLGGPPRLPWRERLAALFD